MIRARRERGRERNRGAFRTCEAFGLLAVNGLGHVESQRDELSSTWETRENVSFEAKNMRAVPI